MATNRWPDKNADLVACAALNLDPETHSIFMMSITAQYVDDEQLEELMRQDPSEYFHEPADIIMQAVHDVKLPDGFCMVGVQKKDGTGPCTFAVIDFSRKE